MKAARRPSGEYRGDQLQSGPGATGSWLAPPAGARRRLISNSQLSKTTREDDRAALGCLIFGPAPARKRGLPPAASTAHRLLMPARLEEKTSVCPSASQSTPITIAWSKVTRRSVPPAAGTTQRSSTSGASERTKAMDWPSGEKAGSESPQAPSGGRVRSRAAAPPSKASRRRRRGPDAACALSTR